MTILLILTLASGLRLEAPMPQAECEQFVTDWKTGKIKAVRLWGVSMKVTAARCVQSQEGEVEL